MSTYGNKYYDKEDEKWTNRFLKWCENRVGAFFSFHLLMGFNKRQIVALKRHNGHKNTPLTFNVVNITIKSERILNAFRYVTIPCFLRMFICIRVTHKTFICPNIFFIFYSFITIKIQTWRNSKTYIFHMNIILFHPCRRIMPFFLWFEITSFTLK